MSRNEKREAQQELNAGVEFASPKLRAAAMKDRGHCRMTPAEYAKHRMGRGAVHPSMIEDVRRGKAETKRGQRELGGRRITGRQPGSKDPQAWAREGVKREITKK